MAVAEEKKEKHTRRERERDTHQTREKPNNKEKSPTRERGLQPDIFEMNFLNFV